MTDKLLPCPFCGGKASTEEYESGASNKDGCVWEVGCSEFDSCHADAPAIRGLATEKRAIEAWNTRKEPDND